MCHISSCPVHSTAQEHSICFVYFFWWALGMTSHRNKPTPTASCVAVACLMRRASAIKSDGQVWTESDVVQKMPDAVSPFPGLALNSSLCSYCPYPQTPEATRDEWKLQNRGQNWCCCRVEQGSKYTFQCRTPRKKIAGRSYVALKTENICLKICFENINLSIAVPTQTDFLLISCEEPSLLGVMKASLTQSCLGLVWEGSFSPFSEGRANTTIFRNSFCVRSQLSWRMNSKYWAASKFLLLTCGGVFAQNLVGEVTGDTVVKHAILRV